MAVSFRGGSVVVALALVISSLLIYRASYAAFSTTTENHGNTFSAGALGLSDNDSNTAIFNATNLVPGSSGSSCITVTYTGTIAPSAPVQLYVAPGDSVDTPGSGGGGGEPAIDWSVETAAGSGIFGAGAGCTGLTGTTIFGNTAVTTVTAGDMLSDFVARNAYSTTGTTSVSSGWTPGTGTSTIVFRFNYKMASDAPNTAMGASATVKITWEARS